MDKGKKKISIFKLTHIAEQWCNRQDRLGCRVSRCMERMENADECNQLLGKFKECVQNKKNQLLEEKYCLDS